MNLNQNDLIKKYSEPSLLFTFGIALFCIVMILSFAYFGNYIQQLGIFIPLQAAVQVICIFCIAVFMRGMEAMMHEASHVRWQKDKGFNDFLANIFAAFPLGKETVEYYRVVHELHHRFLNDPEKDPDLINYNLMRYSEINRTSRRRFIWSVISRYPKIYVSWFKAVTSSALSLMGFISFHSVVILVIAYFVGQNIIAIQLWITYFFIPLVTVLPALRIIGESEEHAPAADNYGYKETVFKTTVNNTGFSQRMCVHPFNDWAHVVHHLKPRVLQVHQPAVAKILFNTNAAYRESVLVRTSLLNNPTFEVAHISKKSTLKLRKNWTLDLLRNKYVFRFIVVKTST